MVYKKKMEVDLFLGGVFLGVWSLFLGGVFLGEWFLSGRTATFSSEMGTEGSYIPKWLCAIGILLERTLKQAYEDPLVPYSMSTMKIAYINKS